MTDREFILALVCANCVVTFGLAYLLASWRKHWSDRRVALFWALAAPGLLIALTAFMIGDAFVTSIVGPEACGVDACGMTMMFGSIGFAAAFAAYVIALLPAFIGARLGR
jgi:hypothetical protein